MLDVFLAGGQGFEIETWCCWQGVGEDGLKGRGMIPLEKSIAMRGRKRPQAPINWHPVLFATPLSRLDRGRKLH